MINLLDSSGNDTTLREFGRHSKHGERLARASLTITHDSAIVTGDHVGDDLRRSQIVDIVLRGVLQDLFKFKLPVVQLVVDDSFVCLVYLDLEFLYDSQVSNFVHMQKIKFRVVGTYAGDRIDLQVVRGELISGACANINLHGLFVRHHDNAQ